MHHLATRKETAGRERNENAQINTLSELEPQMISFTDKRQGRNQKYTIIIKNRSTLGYSKRNLIVPNACFV